MDTFTAFFVVLFCVTLFNGVIVFISQIQEEQKEKEINKSLFVQKWREQMKTERYWQREINTERKISAPMVVSANVCKYCGSYIGNSGHSCTQCGAPIHR
jgi:rubrerythrin